MSLRRRIFIVLFVFWSTVGVLAGTLELLYPGASHVKLNMVPVEGMTAFWTAVIAGMAPGLIFGLLGWGIASLFQVPPPPEAAD
jgi:thiamine transporter ThiT